jgi:hypothetical protein
MLGMIGISIFGMMGISMLGMMGISMFGMMSNSMFFHRWVDEVSQQNYLRIYHIVHMEASFKVTD